MITTSEEAERWNDRRVAALVSERDRYAAALEKLSALEIIDPEDWWEYDTEDGIRYLIGLVNRCREMGL